MSTFDKEITSKAHQSKPRQIASASSQTSIPPISDCTSSTANIEKSSVPATIGGLRRPTIIPTPSLSKPAQNSITKTGSIPSSNTTRPQQTLSMTNSTSSIPEISHSSTATVAKRHIIPTRAIPNISQSSIPSTVRSSSSNSQTSTSLNPTITTTTTTNSVTRAVTSSGGGIPRLTKNSHQIVKPTATTGPTKRSGQVNEYFYFSHNFFNDELIKLAIQRLVFHLQIRIQISTLWKT